MREQHEFNLGQCRNQLTCDSDLDAIKFAFTGEAKKKLAEVLKAISADDANEEKQKKFAFFAAKKDLSADHLNGYLEALDKSENHQAILDQMQLFVDSYWARKEKQLVVTASAVQSPSGSYVASSQVLEQVGEQDGNLSSGGKSKVLKKEEQTSGLEDSYIITPRKRNAPTCNSANYETDEESDL